MTYASVLRSYRMIRDDRVEEYRQKGLQDSLKELEDLMAEYVQVLSSKTINKNRADAYCFLFTAKESLISSRSQVQMLNKRR